MADAGSDGGVGSDSERQKRALRSAEIGARRDRRLLQGIQMTLSGGKRKPRVKNVHASPESELKVESADDLIEKFNSMCLDKASSAKDIRGLLSPRNVEKFDKKDWDRVSDMLAESALRQSDIYFVVDMVVSLIGNKGFQTSFAERISDAMSSFALTPQIADASLPEFVAQLLIAQWPRENSRSNFESNEILYQIITQLKGWIMAITDEDEEDTEMMSRCAEGLADICSYGKRRFWLKWPELLDEIYLAGEEVLVSNTQLSRGAKSALLKTMMHMQEWTKRDTKSTSNAASQTISHY